MNKSTSALPLLFLSGQKEVLSQPSVESKGLANLLARSRDASAVLFITLSSRTSHPRLFHDNAGQQFIDTFQKLIRRHCFAVLADGQPQTTSINLAKRLGFRESIAILELHLNIALSQQHFINLANFLADNLPPDVIPVCVDDMHRVENNQQNLENTLDVNRQLLHQWTNQTTALNTIEPSNKLLFTAFEGGRCQYPSGYISLRFSGYDEMVYGFVWPRYPDSAPLIEPKQSFAYSTLG